MNTLKDCCKDLPFDIIRVNEDFFFNLDRTFIDATEQKEKQERHKSFVAMLKRLCLICKSVPDENTKSIIVSQILNMLSAHYGTNPDTYFVCDTPIAPFVRNGKRLVALDILRASNENFSLWANMVLGRNLFSTPPIEILSFFQNKIMFNKLIAEWLDGDKPQFDLDKAMNLIINEDSKLISKLVDGDENFYTLLSRMKSTF